MGLDQRNDPYLNYRFQVEIDGMIIAGFSEVSGLQVEIETEQYREGGVNDHEQQMVGQTKYSHLMLKRGITDSGVLWQWHRDTVQGTVNRKSGRIILYDSQGNETWRWTFSGAFPVKWEGPAFNADAGATAFETLELAYEAIGKG